MSTRELIHSEIDNLNDDELQVLYQFLKKLIQGNSHQSPESLMSRLMRISIDAPPDFSSHADLYQRENDDRE